MKKIIVLSVFLAFYLFSAGADGYPLQSPARKVVSEIKTYNWSGKKGWFEGPTTKIVVDTYDKQGRLISSELFYQEMILMEKTVYSYEGNLVKKITTDHENKIIRTSTIRYEGNKMIETILHSDNSVFFKTVSHLDNTGRVTVLNHYNNKDELIFEKVYNYSSKAKGEVSQINLYNPDNTFAVSISFNYYDTFDDKGNWIIRKEAYAYGDVRSRPRDYVVRKIEYWGDDNEE